MTWWIVVKSVPEDEIVLEDHHLTEDDVLRLVAIHMHENVVFEIGLD